MVRGPAGELRLNMLGDRRLPKRVNCVVFTVGRPLPIYPNEPTSSDLPDRSVWCRYYCKSRKSNAPESLAKSNFRRRYCCKALYGRYKDRWSFLYEMMWSLTSPHAKRISGLLNSCSSSEKDFFNTIPRTTDITDRPGWSGWCQTGLTFADLVRRKGVKERSCSPAYLATKRRAATPEVEKLQIRAAMKATPIPRSDLIMLTRLSH